MSPKPFTLDSVLSYRKRQESVAQEKFVLAEIAVSKASEMLAKEEHDLQALIHNLEKEQEAGIFAMDLARYQNRIEVGRAEVVRLRKILEEKRDIAVKKRQRLLEKAKEHKVLKTLKEQQNQSWREYLDKKEAAMLDEIAILHHDRTSS